MAVKYALPPPPLHRRTTLTSAFDGALRGGQRSQTCQKAAEGSGSNDTFTQLMQQSGQFRLFVVLLVLFVLLFVLLVLLVLLVVLVVLVVLVLLSVLSVLSALSRLSLGDFSR